MRDLAELQVVKSAAMASVISAAACFPRIATWQTREYPAWYLEAVVLLGGFVLWAFVFAWHVKYAGRPLFVSKLAPTPVALVTVAGIAMALLLHLFVDPFFRARIPEDYPSNLKQWLASTLFSLGLTQLFLIFAPFAWSIRLSKRRWFAASFTVLFGVLVLMLKASSSKTPMAASLICVLAIVRLATSSVSVWLYLRYGIAFPLWWSFLLQTRHLVKLTAEE